ncbi:MAG: hypothetical protein HDR79_07845 [Bacteroides sp.]|nr:hypothetical protein [Bacteroides sp.]
MKEKLEQLTLSQFVDLVCGDTTVLLSSNEAPDAERMVAITRDIVFEYKTIADPRGTNSYCKHVEQWIKAKISVIIFTMCSNLVSLNQHGRAREILSAYGMSASAWSDSRIDGIVQAKLAQSQRELDELERENEKTIGEREKIRARFDEQTAYLMAYFKFQIDPETIKATLYANLVARHNREVKAQLAAMKK